MTLTLPIERIRDEDQPKVGGKAYALASLWKAGFNVPTALCVTSDAYDTYATSTGLRERILMEIHRKAFSDMRWEEVWDASLRIRNMFLTTPMPRSLKDTLGDMIAACFMEKPSAVRSSAPGEDSKRASFAGLHDSYVNVRNPDAILEHVRKVWASLWSDASLLYRRELGLDPEKSTMAVVIQEMVLGDRSGVAFCRSPMETSQAVIESVYGLNQGLVDGTVEPDRWILDRVSGKILSHTQPKRDLWVTPAENGATLESLPPHMAPHPPLNAGEVDAVYRAAMAAEKHFESPQDVEWTFREGILYLLQSRPITTEKGSEPGDDRSWYLSLSKSFDNLKALRQKIENKLIPAMIQEASRLESENLNTLSLDALAREVELRSLLHKKWVETYWRDFIPFAHGARLFGQIYNDAVRPSDPYEFMGLLAATEMESLKRNRLLEDLARYIREDSQLRQLLETGDLVNAEPSFLKRMDDFVSEYGQVICLGTSFTECRTHVCGILLRMAESRPTRVARKDISALTESFLSRFEGKKREEAAEILDLARASYQLRDDDNIYLGRIESALDKVVALAETRLTADSAVEKDRRSFEELIARVKKKAYVPHSAVRVTTAEKRFHVRARQLTGQPAGPGLGEGPARVIFKASDLTEFQSGEILVCDAVDPAITFVVPLCGGIVERRGGMLIHGAIIAREYGLPCVTGVPDATTLIKTGDRVTVDGYLGIVIIGTDTTL
ncbi:MAG: PEP-utilizing enzyme [Desulfobacteraceae bacterium]|nr:PEP-utilizing enzyme [Desulfobacteraceae bacterium]